MTAYIYGDVLAAGSTNEKLIKLLRNMNGNYFICS